MALRNFTDSEEEQIAGIYLSGKSAKSIMRAYGLKHHESIMGALRRQGITQRSKEERNRLYTVNANAFDDLTSEYAAYWLGFIYADGNLSRDKNLSITLSQKDEIHLLKFREFMQSNAPLRYNYSGGGALCTSLLITDKHMGSKLKEFGIISGRPCPNRFFNNISDYTFHHWLRGFFDGDGSARKSQSICFCGGYELLFILRTKIAYMCNVNPNIAICKHCTKNLHYIFYSGRRIALRVADLMYKDATIWLERKRNVIDNWPLPQIRYRNEKGQFT